VVCGILCVLLIGLWVRSYWQFDILDNLYGHRIDVMRGKLVLRERVQPLFGPIPSAPPVSAATFRFLDALTSTSAVVASVRLWILVVIGSLLAAAPWIPWRKRFSLRTLLIAITLVAVGLGLAVAYLRLW
jgi:hypothetical protein